MAEKGEYLEKGARKRNLNLFKKRLAIGAQLAHQIGTKDLLDAARSF